MLQSIAHDDVGDPLITQGSTRVRRRPRPRRAPRGPRKQRAHACLRKATEPNILDALLRLRRNNPYCQLHGHAEIDRADLQTLPDNGQVLF